MPIILKSRDIVSKDNGKSEKENQFHYSCYEADKNVDPADLL